MTEGNQPAEKPTEKQAEELIAELSQSVGEERNTRAEESLVEMGIHAIAPICEALRTENSTGKRQRLCAVLGDIRRSRVAYFDSSKSIPGYPDSREDWERALGAMFESLYIALEDKDPTIKFTALVSLSYGLKPGRLDRIPHGNLERYAKFLRDYHPNALITLLFDALNHDSPEPAQRLKPFIVSLPAKNFAHLIFVIWFGTSGQSEELADLIFGPPPRESKEDVRERVLNRLGLEGATAWSLARRDDPRLILEECGQEPPEQPEWMEPTRQVLHPAAATRTFAGNRAQNMILAFLFAFFGTVLGIPMVVNAIDSKSLSDNVAAIMASSGAVILLGGWTIAVGIILDAVKMPEKAYRDNLPSTDQEDF